MAGLSKRIAVLFHKGDRHRDPSLYIVHHLAEYWRRDGHEVFYLFGVKRFVPADLVLVHVNLSVVPDEYIEFASRYPIALNDRVRDIRKSKISPSLVRPGDAWDGPVIVKSDLNYAGRPERVLQQSWAERHWRPARGVAGLIRRVRGDMFPFTRSTDYEVFDCLADVPQRWLNHQHVVVEKFRPEIEGGLYHTRIYQFLGDRGSCTRLASKHPMVKTSTSLHCEQIEPHEEVLAWREKLEMDYGKLDYVVNNGEVVLLDVNKTTGASPYPNEGKRPSERRSRAEGLYGYFSS